jgi:hypothetical protein
MCNKSSEMSVKHVTSGDLKCPIAEAKIEAFKITLLDCLKTTKNGVFFF